jgi:hypothetical protein
MKFHIKPDLLVIAVTILLAGCKKSIDYTSYETKISFNYNGQQYNRTSPSSISTNVIVVQTWPLFVNFAGLVIDDPALFQGKLILLASSPGQFQCAYLQPTSSSVYATSGNCSMLNNGGNPIDSVQVYWYESGSVNYSYSDCKAISGTTIPGQKDCAITGTFDVTLTNKNHQKIMLTNGTFSGRIKIYP